MKVKTRNRIKFDDKTIEKIKVEDLDFSYINKAEETKFSKMITLPFDVPKKSLLKGLILSVRKNTGSKHFWLRF